MIYPWGIIGHERQLLALETELSNDDLTHAYLFYGPKGTGKFTVAFLLAKILLCQKGLCHKCRDCKLIESGAHPDLIHIADLGETVKIDDVRALISKTNLTSQGKRRVVLIENLERMPIEAQNSFLKTLEEPAGNTIFLMTSYQVKKILPTILSRVRKQEFNLVDDDQMRTALQERFKDNSDLEEVLQMAQGRPGLAIKLLSEPGLLTAYRSSFHRIDQFLGQNDLVAKFAYVEEIEQDSEQMDLFFDAFLLTLRKTTHDFMRKKDHPLKGRYDLKEIAELFENLLETRYLTTRNVNKKLALENFFLQP